MSTAASGLAEGKGRPRLFPRLAPGERRLALWIASIALLGVAIATYLVYIYYADLKPICAAGNGGCETVQASDYADLAGIPVAVLGLIGYLAILGTLLVRGGPGRLAGAAIALRATEPGDRPQAVTSSARSSATRPLSSPMPMRSSTSSARAR